jgi:hypothetical protein
MADLDTELKYLEAAQDEMEAYLLSDELFWPLAAIGGKASPRLTLGGTLLALARAKALADTPARQARLLKAERQLEVTQLRWRTAWGKKAARELASRLRQWAEYLDEYRRHPETQAGYYTYEVRWRVMAGLLQPGAEAIPAAELDLLSALDLRLRAWLQPGDFAWEAALQPAFPAETYWYLYGKLKETLAPEKNERD